MSHACDLCVFMQFKLTVIVVAGTEIEGASCCSEDCK